MLKREKSLAFLLDFCHQNVVMKPYVVLFSGQGAQKVGMGKDLYAEFPEYFERADQLLDYPLSQVMFNGPDEELTRTSRCQPALFIHGLTLFELLKKNCPQLTFSAAAGLSLGEFTAHVASGSMDFQTGLEVVAQRGTFMEEACNTTQGAMAALIGGKEEEVARLAKDCDVDIANLNTIGQIVLSGSHEGIESAIAKAKAYGIRIAKKLNVAGAYHSRLMQSAQERLAKVLLDVRFGEQEVPVVSNFLADVAQSPEDIRLSLERQVTGTVRWTQSMQKLLSQGHSHFIELGPGKVLSGLLSRIDKTATVLSAEDKPSLDALIDTLA